MRSAAEYLRALSAAMEDRYSDTCVVHACRIAELLRAEGASPWIGRLRDVARLGEHVVHAPLIPLRYRGKGSIAWDTHYVACAGREVFDPLHGRPVDLDAYAVAVFGRALAIEPHLDGDQTAQALTAGDLARRCVSR